MIYECPNCRNRQCRKCGAVSTQTMDITHADPCGSDGRTSFMYCDDCETFDTDREMILTVAEAELARHIVMTYMNIKGGEISGNTRHLYAKLRRFCGE